MSTITKEFTKERLQQIEAAAKEVLWPVVWSEKKAREHFCEKITPGVVMALSRTALASLETEASGRNPVLAYADSYRDMANQGVESIPVWSVITDLERNIAPLFTAPPPPLSVPAAMEIDDDFDSALNTEKLSAGTPIAQPCFRVPMATLLMVGWPAVSECRKPW